MLFREDCVLKTWLVPHADRFLHGQDFSTHVAAVRQAPFGGIWLVEMLVEIVRQVEDPAPRSRGILAECGVSRPTGAYLLAFSSSLLRAVSCGIGDSPRFFTGEILQLQKA